MDEETKAGLKALKELRIGGRILQMVTARKGYKCDECGLPIEPGEKYYRRYVGGAGLHNLKFPDHIHIACVEKEPV